MVIFESQAVRGRATSFKCRFCGATLQTTFVDLGIHPICNSLIRPNQLTAAEPFYPLHVYVCDECFLVQIQEFVPTDEIFTEYSYFSSYSTSWVEHARRYTSMMIERFGFDSSSHVFEVASNDGYLLQYFKKGGVPVLGIEPAANIAAVARDERQIPTVSEFFGRDLAARLVSDGRRADVILGLNVMAHVPDLNGFMSGVATMLAPGGVAVIEVPYVRDMVDRNEFDTIYHEHLCYFSVHAVAALVRRHGLSLERVERISIHGGSLRLFIAAGDRHGPTALRLLEEEAALGITREEYYREFRTAVERVREDLNATLARLRAEGATIGAYGAAAKGSILLNYCGITADTVAFVADRSPYKQGRRMPGCGIPVVDPRVIIERQPDCVLILVWNLKDEVLRQEETYRRRGGRFFVAVPRIEFQ
jgi:SAM-dependent methyltransferase